MRYVVVKDFSDIQDERHIYLTGDIFPREGLNVSEERVAELASENNMRGEVLIKAVEDKNEKAVDNSNSVKTDENDEVKNENDVIKSEGKPKKEKKKEK